MSSGFCSRKKELLAYRDAPSDEAAQKMRSEFWQIFGTLSGYEELERRKRLAAAKMKELLLVLEHPKLPLHFGPGGIRSQDNGSAT
jgi:hypothetical protein